MACSTYIVILAEAEETADLGGTLGAETLGVNGVGEAGDFLLTLLDDSKGKDGEIERGDATTDGLSLALTGAAGAVAGVAVGEEEADTVGDNDTLLHRETLLVVTTGDAEDIALPLVTEEIGGDLSAHLLLLLVSSGKNRSYGNSGFVGRTYALPKITQLAKSPEQIEAIGETYSMKLRSFFSSSISMSFCEPFAGWEMFSCG